MRSPVLALVTGTVAALAAALPAAPARADLVQLDDGRWIEGVKMRVEGEGIVLQYKAGEVLVPLARVVDYVIDGVPPFEPRTDEERARRAEGLVPFGGKWVKPEVREKAMREQQAKRKAELEEIKAHQEWRNRWKFETKNFLFESTLPPKINEQYSTMLEGFFEEHKKAWGLKVPKEWGKLKVCLYHDRKSYNQVSGGRGGTYAYYRFVEPRELDCFYDRRDPQLAIGAALHETTHYMVDLLDEKTQQPHSLNEAVAEYFGASTFDPKTKSWKPGGIQEGRLAEVRADMDGGKKMRLQDLLGSEGQYESYTWGWTFVHFMMESPAWKKRFWPFFVDLAKAKDVERKDAGFGFTKPSGDETLRYFCKKMGLQSLDAVEADWHAWIEKLEPTGLRGLEAAGISSFQQGRIKFRAPRQLKAAIDAGSRRPLVHLLYSRCLRFKGTKEAAEESLAVIVSALEKVDSLDGDLWAERGFILHMLDRKDEAKKYVELARELNPDEPYLEIEVVEALAGGEGE